MYDAYYGMSNVCLMNIMPGGYYWMNNAQLALEYHNYQGKLYENDYEINGP